MDSNTIGSTAAAPAAIAAATTATAGAAANRTPAAEPVSKTQSNSAATTAAKETAEPQRDPRSLQFRVDGDKVITTIIDSNDKTVVIQIPSADMIRIAKSIDRMQGFLIQEKA